MVATIFTVAGRGPEACHVEVRCQIEAGTPDLVMLGLSQGSAAGIAQRVRAAFSATGLALPSRRITITFTPADLQGESAHYDLPVALVLIAALGMAEAPQLADCIAVGELTLDGRIVTTPAIAGAALLASGSGKSLVCSAADVAEAGDLPVIAARNLPTLLRRLRERSGKRPPAMVEDRRMAGQPQLSMWSKALSLIKRGTSSTSASGHQEQSPPEQPSSTVVREAAGAPFVPQQSDRPRRSGEASEWVPSRVMTRSERRDFDANFHGIGHRERLRDRLIEGGTEALADYEVLEFLLFGARRKGDTKPLAKVLIKRFGSLPAVLNADPSALMQVPGIGRHSVGVIKIAAVAAKRMARAQVREQPLLGSWSALIDYLSIDMAHLTRERVRVLYLDTKNRLVKDEHISEGTLDEASVHPREVIHHALDSGASALILVHNHPSGSPEPSKADIQLTHRIAEAGRLVGITVHDHVIVGREGHVSLRAKGLI